MSRLEWAQCHNEVWRAQVANIHLGAWELPVPAVRFRWSIGDNDTTHSAGSADSLDDAKAAAESAALALACSAVAALAPDPADDAWLSRVIDRDETFGLSVEATSLEAGDRAERLGCALIASAAAARERTR